MEESQEYIEEECPGCEFREKEATQEELEMSADILEEDDGQDRERQE